VDSYFSPPLKQDKKVLDQEENTKQLDEYEREMRKAGLVADRRHNLLTYKNCFIGRELVDWLISRSIAFSRSEARMIGDRLFDAGRIRHVVDQHRFEDNYLFYRFLSDEPALDGPSVQKLSSLEKQNVHKGSVLLKGTWKYNRVYAMLWREGKKLYLFDSELSVAPRKIVDLARFKYSVSECSICKKGYLCLRLEGAEELVVICVERAEQQDEWLHSLVSAGVASTEDEEAKSEAPLSFF